MREVVPQPKAVMPIQSQEPFALSKNQQQAYRRLLYHAMLDIRTLCQSRGPESRNPIEWRRRYRLTRIAGALADWLHNLALLHPPNFRVFALMASGNNTSISVNVFPPRLVRENGSITRRATRTIWPNSTHVATGESFPVACYLFPEVSFDSSTTIN